MFYRALAWHLNIKCCMKFSIITLSDGYWGWDNEEVEVNVGDTVNGWYNVVIQGEGLDCLEQSWVAREGMYIILSTIH